MRIVGKRVFLLLILLTMNPAVNEVTYLDPYNGYEHCWTVRETAPEGQDYRDFFMFQDGTKKRVSFVSSTMQNIPSMEYMGQGRNCKKYSTFEVTEEEKRVGLIEKRYSDAIEAELKKHDPVELTRGSLLRSLEGDFNEIRKWYNDKGHAAAVEELDASYETVKTGKTGMMIHEAFNKIFEMKRNTWVYR